MRSWLGRRKKDTDGGGRLHPRASMPAHAPRCLGPLPLQCRASLTPLHAPQAWVGCPPRTRPSCGCSRWRLAKCAACTSLPTPPSFYPHASPRPPLTSPRTQLHHGLHAAHTTHSSLTHRHSSAHPLASSLSSTQQQDGGGVALAVPSGGPSAAPRRHYVLVHVPRPPHADRLAVCRGHRSPDGPGHRDGT